MALNGNFINKYGKSWDDMDEGQKQMALMSELFDLRESVEPVKDLCDKVSQHSTYLKWIGVAVTAIGIPVLLMLVSFVLTAIKGGG